jgi:hypothetical protein
MEITTTSNRMFSLLVLYDMQTLYFERALEKISDEDAHKRLDTKANHIAWLTGSLVQQRYEIANLLGVFRKTEGIRIVSGWERHTGWPEISIAITI